MSTDKNTFGSTRAAEILAELLGKYPKSSRAASKAFHDYTRAMNDLMLVPPRSRLAVYQCWYEKCQKRVEDSSLPDEVKRFLHNVIQTHYKHRVKAFRGLRPSDPGRKPGNCSECGLPFDDHPRCQKCGYTACDCRTYGDHRLCGEPAPAKPGRSQ